MCGYGVSEGMHSICMYIRYVGMGCLKGCVLKVWGGEGICMYMCRYYKR